MAAFMASLPMDDHQCLRQAAAGDPRAARELFDRHGDRLYRIVLSTWGDADFAEDVVQETMIRAIRKASQYQGGSSLLTWLVRIAFRIGLDLKGRRKREFTGDHFSQLVDTSRSAAEAHERSEDSRLIRDALARLQEYPRQLMVLRHYAGFSTRELAEVFDKREPAIRKDLQRARDKLRPLLEPWFGSGPPEDAHV
jgi:RNA polymerase sigma-70 factor, ECF subfamily